MHSLTILILHAVNSVGGHIFYCYYIIKVSSHLFIIVACDILSGFVYNAPFIVFSDC